MGNRLSKIVTRTGDAGTTGLGDGTRVAKDSSRIAAIGEIDELNSSLGALLAEDLPNAIRDAVLNTQHDLFDLGGEICIPGSSAIGEEHINRLETLISQFNDELPPLKEFILPGGTRAAALSHLARAICRRAERQIVNLGNTERVNEAARKYVNRLSDLLFVFGRALNKVEGRNDVLWEHSRDQDPQPK